MMATGAAIAYSTGTAVYSPTGGAWEIDYGTTATTTNDSIWVPYYASGTDTISLVSSDTAKIIRGAADWTRISQSEWYGKYDYGYASPSPSTRLRRILRDRHSPAIRTSRRPVGLSEDEREGRARETLRRVIGTDAFRRFLKHGFVSVRGKSGLVYQIFPGHGITNVYDHGKHVDRLCVVLSGRFPPTDSLIMRYLLILNDERDFRKQAIQHALKKKTPIQVEPERDLISLWKNLKAAA